MSGTSTHYDALEVPNTATYEEIKESFHRLARAKHPDKRRQNKPPQTINLNLNRQQQQQQLQDDNISDDDNEIIGEDKAAAEFRKVQQAWQVLRDSDERGAYDSDLLQKDLQEKNKRNGALVLSYHDDLEEAVDEETNERFMVYDCRCGEEIHVDVDVFPSDGSDDTDVAQSTNSEDNDNDILIDCPGCCFVYRIIGK